MLILISIYLSIGFFIFLLIDDPESLHLTLTWGLIATALFLILFITGIIVLLLKPIIYFRHKYFQYKQRH